MATQCSYLLPLLYLAIAGAATWRHLSPERFGRRSFPDDFVFGAATAAYQIEGAINEGGRGPSIWDTFTQKHPEKIADGSNGTVAADSYHRYKEDVKMIKEMGMDAYRFSISWSRILPNGKIDGGINEEGVQYYDNLINEIKSNGLEPYVTIFHWDVPQALEDQYGGFLSPKIMEDYQDYASLCFELFGDRVRQWITLNEPWTFAINGYLKGQSAPGRCSPWKDNNCNSGDSTVEPYIVVHHELLAHAAAVKVYRDKYQASQKGKIGIVLNCPWYIPHSDTKSDSEAAIREIDFTLGWFMDPLTEGDYPFIMKAIAQDRLPVFTAEQSKLVNGSFDFIGLNYYASYYAQSLPFSRIPHSDPEKEKYVEPTTFRNGLPIGPMGASIWLWIYPPGLKDILIYIKDKYKNPVIYVTENGVDEVNNSTATLENALNDDLRIEYYKHHLEYVRMAIREGVKVKGYFAWSLLDNFEWESGYTVRFGLYYVDYKTLARYPKKSALWFQKFLKRSGFWMF